MSKRAAEAKKPKSSYTVYSPPYFGGRELGNTFASDKSQLIGRVLRTSLYALTDDFSKQYLLLKFRIVNVKDNVAETEFHGHAYGREFLRSLVRRGSTKVEGVFDVRTADGFGVRLTATVFAAGKATSSKQRSTRKVMMEVLQDAAKKLTLDQLAQELVLGKTASDIYNAVKKIVSPRHVGVISSKVIEAPARTTAVQTTQQESAAVAEA